MPSGRTLERGRRVAGGRQLSYAGRGSSVLGVPGAAFLFESHVGMTVDTGAITRWADLQSGSGLVVKQATVLKQPLYTAANSNFNNYPTADWTLANVGNVPFLESDLLPAFIRQPLTILIVARFTDSFAANRNVIGNRNPQTNNNQAIAVLTSAKVRLTGFSAPALDSTGTLSLDTSYILWATAAVGTGTIYNQATSLGTGTIGTGAFDGIRIGANGFTAAGSAAMVGNIATVGCWPSVLTASDMATATTVLKARYSIA